MGDGKDDDFIISLITSLLCFLVLIGGVFLILYFCEPHATHPLFAVAALLLIGSPWIFWFLTYLYMCMKATGRWARLMTGRSK